MSHAAHPDDATLLAIAAGEPGLDAAAAHVAGCPVCRADVEAFRALRAVGAEAPSPFVTSRAERDLLRAIDGEVVERRRAWRPAAVAAAVILSASSGALAASLVLRARAPEAAPRLEQRDDATSGARRPAPSPNAAPEAPAVPATLSSALSSAPAAPSPAPALFSPLAAAAAVGAAAPSVGPPAPRAPRSRADAPSVAHTPAPAGDDEASAMRARCEHGLLTARDRASVDACRAFAQRYPADPAVRMLAFAAGRVAEDELDDPALAEQEYERALLLSPFAGVPATDALWARARVRARQGELDEARADLRLYIAQVPSARHDDAVIALARTLGLVP